MQLSPKVLVGQVQVNALGFHDIFGGGQMQSCPIRSRGSGQF
jgi:hypothetical protein